MPKPLEESDNALRIWMTLVEQDDKSHAAIGAYRTLARLIESGKAPNWGNFNLTPSAFYGWGLLHVPERKKVDLAFALANMDEAGKGLKQRVESYKTHNDKLANGSRVSVPPAAPLSEQKLRCPKCTILMSGDLEPHVSNCRPWNVIKVSDREEILKRNRDILTARKLALTPPQESPQPVITTPFRNPQDQYGSCVNELGNVHARLVQAPASHEIRGLTSRARRLLDLIDSAAIGI